MAFIKEHLMGKNKEVKCLVRNVFLPLQHGNCFHIQIMYKSSEADGCCAGGNGSESCLFSLRNDYTVAIVGSCNETLSKHSLKRATTV